MDNRTWRAGLAALALALAAGGCAAGSADPAPDAVPANLAVTSGPIRPTVVPDLTSRSVELVDKEIPAAGLVALIRHQTGGGGTPGTVLRTDPAGGSSVEIGSVVTVVVAGPPGDSLDDLVRAHRDRYVGLGVDADGTLVVAVGAGVSERDAQSDVRPRAAGRGYRLVSCPTTWTDLERIRIELSQPGVVEAATYAIDLDVAACAVRLHADLSPAAQAALTAKFGPTLLRIGPGGAARMPRR